MRHSAHASATLAAQLIRWDDIAQILEFLPPKNDRRHWLVPHPWPARSAITSYNADPPDNSPIALVVQFSATRRLRRRGATPIDSSSNISAEGHRAALIERQLWQGQAADRVADQLGVH